MRSDALKLIEKPKDLISKHPQQPTLEEVTFSLGVLSNLMSLNI